ncbi:EAL domain-containing protein [Ferrovum sp.]|uniref:EAL domain-containing protein n=3 Tax=Ferrovum sp. TaxID=2609467 RepID=UPI0026188B2F|nr:EAL domain-containing protein [Ferrovum sp.]
MNEEGPHLALVHFSTHILQALAQGVQAISLAEEICVFAESIISERIASLMIVDENGRLQPLAAPHAPSELVRTLSDLIPGPHAGSCGNVIYRQEPVVVGDIPHDSRWDDLRVQAETWKLKSCWSWPVRKDKRLVGTFALTGLVEGEPSVDQIGLLESCAALAGMVLIHSLPLLRQEEENKRRLYRALFGSVEALIQNQSDQEMQQSLCSNLTNDTLFSAAWIGRPGPDGYFEVMAKSGTGARQIIEARPRLTQAEDSPLVVRAWQTGQTALSNDTLSDASLHHWHALFAKNRWRSLLATPVQRGEELWAVLVLASSCTDTFDEDTLGLCLRVASLLSRSLEEHDLKLRIHALQREDAQLARTDSLTGLPNRLALEEYLPKAMARAERHERVVALGMIDLDDFKPVNDRYGHEQGDILLQELAQRLGHKIRESNYLARLGGDEFVVVFEDLDESQVQHELGSALVRLHQAVELPFYLDGPEGGVMIDMTMGVVLYPGDAETQEELMRKADAAMYQAKLHKHERVKWWVLSSVPMEEPAPEGPFDPFGSEAQFLLSLVQPYLEQVTDEFTHSFYDDMERDENTLEILQTLADDEYLELKRSQSAYLSFLIDPATTYEQIQAQAARLGRVHALIGVTGAWMTRAMSLYRGLLRHYLDTLSLVSRERYRALRVIDARLQIDVEGQLDVLQQTTDLYSAYHSRPLDSFSGQWLEVAQSELESLSSLPGILVGQILRPQADGIFATELNAGVKSQALESILRIPGMRPILDTRSEAGQGLIARAWHSGQIQRTDAYQMDARTHTWHSSFRPLGIRSAVAIPIRGPQEMEFVMIVLGAYPHQFSSGWMRTFIASLQNRWEQLVRLSHANRFPVMDSQQATIYRERLHSGGLRLFMQPVVELKTGALFKVEALARLAMPDGSLIMPGKFLTALRSSDLDALFRQGLAQGLEWVRECRGRGFDFPLSINLSPSTLLHPSCVQWVEEALRKNEIAPAQLTLELLETQDFDQGMVDEAITQLERLGVKLAIDDLGSGFSSLKRLASLPFDVIKVDQAMVRDIFSEPLKTLSLIRTIIQIGYDLERVVIVEGVENESILEAVALLGAHYAQGYALACPMPKEQLVSWVGQPRKPVPTGNPLRTYLGALAHHWRYMQRVGKRREMGSQMALEACPLTHFLREKGLEGAAVAQWHAQVHETNLAGIRQEASDRLKDWLVEQVRAEKNV